MESYTAALEAQMQKLGYETFRRKDEHGIEQVCFLLPVNDAGDEVFAQLSVFGKNEYYFCMELHSMVAGSFGDDLPALETAVGLWNREAFGAYVVDRTAQNLIHRQFNLVDAENSAEDTARLAVYVLAVVREEINSRLPDVLNYIDLRDNPGRPNDLPSPPADR